MSRGFVFNEKCFPIFILLITFYFFSSIKGSQDWIYQEQIDTQAMNFRYISKTEPSSYVINMANNMHLYPPDRTITGAALTFSPDLAKVRDCLARMGPCNAIILYQVCFESL